MRNVKLAMLALLAVGTATIRASVPQPRTTIPGASWAGSSGTPATACMRPKPNVWRLHPGDGTSIAASTRASRTGSSSPSSSHSPSGAGVTTGAITTSKFHASGLTPFRLRLF